MLGQRRRRLADIVSGILKIVYPKKKKKKIKVEGRESRVEGVFEISLSVGTLGSFSNLGGWLSCA